jgi:hypothetical protein
LHWWFDEQAANRRKIAAAQTIILWHHCTCLQIRLDSLTARQRNHKLALACFQYELECFAHAEKLREEAKEQAIALAAEQ